MSTLWKQINTNFFVCYEISSYVNHKPLIQHNKSHGSDVLGLHNKRQYIEKSFIFAHFQRLGQKSNTYAYMITKIFFDLNW